MAKTIILTCLAGIALVLIWLANAHYTYVSGSGEAYGFRIGQTRAEALQRVVDQRDIDWIEFRAIGGRGVVHSEDLSGIDAGADFEVRFSDGRLWRAWLWTRVEDGTLVDVSTNMWVGHRAFRVGMNAEEVIGAFSDLLDERPRGYLSIGAQRSEMAPTSAAELEVFAYQSDIWFTKLSGTEQSLTLVFADDKLRKIVARNFFVELP